MNLHVIIENRDPKMLYTSFSQLAWASTSEKADLSLFNHRGKDHLDAALAQPAILLPAGHVDRGGKALKALCLTLSRNAVTSHLVGLRIGLGTHRNSERAGWLSGTCRYARHPSRTHVGKQLPGLPKAAVLTLNTAPPSC